MAFRFQNPRAGTQPVNVTSTVQRHPVGTIMTAEDPTFLSGEFIYLQGVGSTVVSSWVTYLMDGGTTALMVSSAIGPVAVAMSINVLSSWGWYQISGKAVGKCLTQFADNGIVWATGTAGSVDDASVAGDLIHRAKGASLTVVDSTVAHFEIERPFMDDGQVN